MIFEKEIEINGKVETVYVYESIGEYVEGPFANYYRNIKTGEGEQ